MEELRALQKKREELRVKLKEAEARYDLAMVADLKCAPAPACRDTGSAAGARAGRAAVPQACRKPASHKQNADKQLCLYSEVTRRAHAQVRRAGRDRGRHPGQGQEPAARQHAERGGAPAARAPRRSAGLLPSLDRRIAHVLRHCMHQPTVHPRMYMFLCVSPDALTPRRWPPAKHESLPHHRRSAALHAPADCASVYVCFHVWVRSGPQRGRRRGTGGGGGRGGRGVALDGHPGAAAVREREGAPAAPGRGAAPAGRGCGRARCPLLAQSACRHSEARAHGAEHAACCEGCIGGLQR